MLLEPVDNPAVLDHRAHKVPVDLKVSKGHQDPQDHLDLMDNQDLQGALDHLVG